VLYIEFIRGPLVYPAASPPGRMSGGVWAPFKELVRVVNDAILRKEPSAYFKLESELKKHKPDFLSLLKNPVSFNFALWS
jgi:hypothetical protein